MYAHETVMPAGPANPPTVARRFLRLPDVMQMIGLGRSKIYQMIANGEFPKPHKLGRKVSVWLIEDVLAWMEQRIGFQ